MIISIYGLFEGDECLYVGQTRRPTSRIIDHRKRLSMPSIEMKIFRLCRLSDARRIETQVINAFWRRGEAVFNRKYGRPKLPPDEKLRTVSFTLTRPERARVERYAAANREEFTVFIRKLVLDLCPELPHATEQINPAS